MSRIAILIEQPLAASTLSELCKATDLSLLALQQRLKDGKPVLDKELFRNDHEAIAARLMGILATAAHAKVVLFIFELKSEEDFESAPLGRCRIDAITLENILTEWEHRRDEI